MNRSEFNQIITMLKAFPKYDKETYTQNTWAMYYQALKDYDAQDVQLRVMECFKESPFIPTADKLAPKGRKKMDRTWMKPYIEANAKAAENTVSKYARTHGLTWNQAYEELRNENRTH